MASPLIPGESQRLLLRAALLDDSAGREAWDRWRAKVRLEELDAGSSRLLPLLYRRLEAAGLHEDPWFARLRGVYRHSWSANAACLAELRRVLLACAPRGVRTVVLDGAALATTYYEDLGCRPVSTLAVLVAPEDLRAAAEVLRGEGWAVPAGWPPPGVHRTVGWTRFAGSRNGFDLWWEPFPDGCAPALMHQALSGAEPTRVGEVETVVLSPTHELLRACVRAARGDPVPPFRFLADAATVLRRAAERIDWALLTAGARQARLVLPVLASLRLLREVVDAPVPEAVIRELAAARASLSQRLEHRLQGAPQPVLGRLPHLLFRYGRLAEAGSAGSGLSGLLGYLRETWGARSSWELPLLVLRKGLHRTGLLSG